MILYGAFVRVQWTINDPLRHFPARADVPNYTIFTGPRGADGHAEASWPVTLSM